MKSPDQLAAQWGRQWQNVELRLERLLGGNGGPWSLPIGRPSASRFTRDTAAVREHIVRWRGVDVGQVDWEPMRFRSAAEPVDVPVAWRLHTADEWALASADAVVQHELTRLRRFIADVDSRFHALLIRQRSLWRDREDCDVCLAAILAMELVPGIAAGAPLRSLATAGIDSKFIEHHRSIVIAMLDARFDGQASARGLETFLDAALEGEHWLLVASLSPGLLPFEQLRIRARELQQMPLPAGRILLIENERSLHQLPALEDTIAVLGSGLDLAWLQADWLRQRRVAYWGDLDTWGLRMLASARKALPHLHALLMDRVVFDRFADSLAVVEPVNAGDEVPSELTDDEQALYRHLRDQPKGRIEQEFLPRDAVIAALAAWQPTS